MVVARGRARQRPLVEPGETQLTPGGSRRLCMLESAPTPGSSRRSPIVYKQELTPAGECGSPRKRRLDRNRQAEVYAARRLVRGTKPAKPTSLDFERRIVDSVDLAQPELSFGVEALEARILTAQHSRRQDLREAAAVLRGPFEREVKVHAAVHVMMGRHAECKWTLTGKLRAVCSVCKQSYATKLDGTVRKHQCCV